MFRIIADRHPKRRLFAHCSRTAAALLVLTFSVGGNVLPAISARLPTFSLREGRTCQPAASRVRGPSQEVTGVAWSKDGRLIIGYSAYGTEVTIWNSANCNRLNSFFVNDSQYIGPSIGFTADGKRVVTPASMASRADNRYTLDLWDLSTLEVVQRIEGPGRAEDLRKNRLSRFDLSSDGALIAFTTTDFGAPITVFDVNHSAAANSISIPTTPWRDSASALAFSRVQPTLAIGYQSGVVNIFSDARHSDFKQFVSYDRSLNIGIGAIAFVPDGTRLATGALVGSNIPANNHYSSVKLWQASDRKLEEEFAPQSGGVNSLSWDPTGRYVAAAMANHALLLLDSAGGGVATKQFGTAPVYSAEFSPDGRELAVATGDGLEIFELHK